MTTKTTKPLCLLVGGSPRKHEALSELLDAEVILSDETPESCVRSARAKGARFAVVFWHREADEIAHRLKKDVPHLKVLVENNPVAMSGRVERNGFASMFDTRNDLQEVAANIKNLCRPETRTTRSVPERMPALAATFVAHLPAIQSSLEEAERLGAHLLHSLLQATQANKGLVFYKDEEEGEYRVLSRLRIGEDAVSQITPGSELGQVIESMETSIHTEDEDAPAIILSHLEGSGCNLLVPLIAQDGLEGWVLLKVRQGREELDYVTLQSIAYFAADSFRIGRCIRESALREAQLQAGLAHETSAVMIVDRHGAIQYLSNPNHLLKFRPGPTKSSQTLLCGTMRLAIADCLRGKIERRSWKIGADKENRVSVVRLTSKAALVVVRPEMKEQAIQIDGNVWSEIAASAKGKANFGVPLHRTLGALLSESSESRWTVNVFEEVAEDILCSEQVEGLICFLQKLGEQSLKSVQIVASRKSKGVTRLGITCETGALNATETGLGVSLVTLINAKTKITKEACSIGCRWRLDFPIHSRPMNRFAQGTELRTVVNKLGIEQ